MFKILQKFMLILMILTFVSIAYAQDNPELPFAGVIDNTLYIFGVDDAPIEVIHSDFMYHAFIDFDWSGSTLAFIMYDENAEPALMVTDSTGSEPFGLETGDLEISPGVSFTPEGQILFAQQDAVSIETQPMITVGFYTIAPEANASAEHIASIEFMTGCNGGPAYPTERIYWIEAGFAGNGLILEQTDFGILYSMNCSGVGTALLNPEGTAAVEVGTSLARGRVSLDGTQVAGIGLTFSDTGGGTIQIVDLATLAITEAATTMIPDQIAWGTDGTLFYSSIDNSVNLVDLLSDQERRDLNAALDNETNYLPFNTVSIRQLDLTTGEDTEIYSAEAYAVGRMFATEHALYFSQIPNLEEWVVLVANGLDFTTVEAFAQETAAVAPDVLRLNVETGDVEVIAENVIQFTPNQTSP